MPNQQLITHARGHVTGEYAQNTVYLTGERVSDAGFYQNIRLSVQPSIGSAETCIRPAEDSGYNPRLFLGRMTDAPTEQILLSIASGGSGAIGYYSVYGYENGALRTLMTTAQYNNAFQYGEYSLCGTRGWFYEEEKGGEHDKKIMLREVGRLEASLKAALTDKKLVFLHYPPIFQKYECPEILRLLREHEVRLCCYGHIHGKGCAAAFNGWRGGTEYKLVSADWVDFTPVKIIE